MFKSSFTITVVVYCFHFSKHPNTTLETGILLNVSQLGLTMVYQRTDCFQYVHQILTPRGSYLIPRFSDGLWIMFRFEIRTQDGRT